MNDTIINHCKPGGGCSKCVSCKDPESQKLCSFYIKAQFHNRCTNTKFEAYCSCRNAYDNAMGKDVPLDQIPNKSTSDLFELTHELLEELQNWSAPERGEKKIGQDYIPTRRDYSRDPARHPSSLSHLSPKFADYIKRCEEKEAEVPCSDISDARFWVDSGGKHPGPFTSITAQDIFDNKWMPTESKFQRDAEYFYDMLEMPITIFPHHHLSVNPCAEVILGEAISHCVVDELHLEFSTFMEIERLDMLFNEGRVMYHNFLGWYYDTQTEIFYNNQGFPVVPSEKDLRRFTEDPFHDVHGKQYWL